MGPKQRTNNAAAALRDHWNRVRAPRPHSGDSKLGALIGDLLETIADERTQAQAAAMSCICPASSEYDPPCPVHGILGIGVTGR